MHESATFQPAWVLETEGGLVVCQPLHQTIAIMDWLLVQDAKRVVRRSFVLEVCSTSASKRSKTIGLAANSSCHSAQNS